MDDVSSGLRQRAHGEGYVFGKRAEAVLTPIRLWPPEGHKKAAQSKTERLLPAHGYPKGAAPEGAYRAR